MSSTGRSFHTGKVGDFPTRWANRQVPPVRYKINTHALENPAIPTIHQVLTAPTENDKLRLEFGQTFLDAADTLTLT